MRGADCGSDHYLMVSRVRLMGGWGTKKRKSVDLQRVKTKCLVSKKDEYRENVKVKLGRVNEELSDVEEVWNHFQSCVVEAAKEVCGVTRVGRERGTAWWNDRVAQAVKEKKEAYMCVLNGNVNEDEY